MVKRLHLKEVWYEKKGVYVIQGVSVPRALRLRVDCQKLYSHLTPKRLCMGGKFDIVDINKECKLV